MLYIVNKDPFTYEKETSKKMCFLFKFKGSPRGPYTILRGFNSDEEFADFINECYLDESDGKLDNWETYTKEKDDQKQKVR